MSDSLVIAGKAYSSRLLVGTGKSPANHNPKFHVDPAALGPAAKYMARLAKEAFVRL